MKYKVIVSVANEEKNLEDEFYAVVINNEAGVLMLFKEVNCFIGNGAEKIIRYAIPMTDIKHLEIIPIYEDNKQAFPRC